LCRSRPAAKDVMGHYSFRGLCLCKRDFPAASYGAPRVVNAGELLDRITLEI
jgi:hypothetical protein